MVRLSVSLIALLGLVAFVGCGDGVTRSEVKVNITSSKVKLEETDSISVGFTPEGEGEIAMASGSARELPLTANPSGKEAQGVAPGKYKLTVAITPYAGMSQPGHDQAVQELSNRFDATNSKLTYEVAAGKQQTITIDLDAGTVTAN